jgi:hypothetical protein
MKNYLTKENGLDHLKILNSVGCMFNSSTGVVMPTMEDGSFDVDNPLDIMEHDPEWFNSLSIKDFDVVEDWFDKEDLDIRGMLLGMDGLTFDNPKDEYDFDMAMNGINVY